MKKRTLITTIATMALALTAPTTVKAADTFFQFSDVTGYYIEDTSHLYPLTGIVTHIEYDAVPDQDLIIITCGNGNEFSFYAPVGDDWELEDLASCIMDSKGTSLVYDDEVIVAKYAGVTEQFEEVLESK